MGSRTKRDERLARLENALRDMNRALEDPDAADEDVIMRRVARAERSRRSAPSKLSASIELIESRRLFARFAAGAALAAVLAGVYATATGYGPEFELSRIYALDPAGLLLMPLLGA